MTVTLALLHIRRNGTNYYRVSYRTIDKHSLVDGELLVDEVDSIEVDSKETANDRKNTIREKAEDLKADEANDLYHYDDRVKTRLSQLLREKEPVSGSSSVRSGTNYYPYNLPASLSEGSFPWGFVLAGGFLGLAYLWWTKK